MQYLDYLELEGPHIWIGLWKLIGNLGHKIRVLSRLPLHPKPKILNGDRPKTLVYILYKAGTCEKQNQCFSVVAKDPRKHGERAGERVI